MNLHFNSVLGLSFQGKLLHLTGDAVPMPSTSEGYNVTVLRVEFLEEIVKVRQTDDRTLGCRYSNVTTGWR